MKKGLLIGLVVLAAVLIWMLLFPRTSRDEVRFGSSMGLSGDAASYGVNARRGIEIAMAEVNDGKGLLGKRVIVDFQDDQNNATMAVNIVTKFATQERLPLFFGCAGSTVSEAVMPLAQQYNVVQVTPISSASRLSSKGNPFFFRTCPADDLQAKVLAEWVFDSGARKVAVIFTKNAWGEPLATGFAASFEALGGTVLSQEGVQPGIEDLRTPILKVKDLPGVDALVSPTYPKEGGALVRQCRQLDLRIPLYGGDNWGSPEFREMAGEAAEGVFYTSPAISKSPIYDAFAKKYEQRYGSKPDVFGAYGYDAAKAVFAAVEAAGTTESEALRVALLKVSFQGASGPIAFKGNGDLKSEGFDRMTVKGGQPQPVQ